MKRLAILTCQEYADLAADDRLFAEALTRRGIAPVPVVWTASDAWKTCDAVLVRSTWDYHLQPERFAAFLKSSRKAVGVDEILLPGEIERRTREARIADGIEIDDVTWGALSKAAKSVGVDRLPVPNA